MMARVVQRYAVERRQWKAALALQPVAGATPGIQAETFWAHAVAAGHLRDAAAAQESLTHYEERVEAFKRSPKGYLAEGLKDEHDEVKAWAAYARGNTDEALRLLHAAADDQDKIGKGESELPAREMIADMLLELNRPQEA